MYLFVNIVLLNSTAPSECSDPRVRRDSARKSISRNELWKWKNHICHAGHTPIHPAEGPDQPPLLSSYFFFLWNALIFRELAVPRHIAASLSEPQLHLITACDPSKLLLKKILGRSKCHRASGLKSLLKCTAHYQKLSTVTITIVTSVNQDALRLIM